MEATFVGIHMWKQAVEKAKSADVDKVRVAMIGQTMAAPSGFVLTMDGNHHLHKPVMIGEDSRRRAVQRRVADEDRDSRAAVEPLYCRESGQAGYGQFDSGVLAAFKSGVMCRWRLGWWGDVYTV